MLVEVKVKSESEIDDVESIMKLFIYVYVLIVNMVVNLFYLGIRMMDVYFI